MDKVDLGEREAIVRWLRTNADQAVAYMAEHKDFCAEYLPWMHSQIDAIEDAAKRIERGEHLTNPGATNEG